MVDSTPAQTQRQSVPCHLLAIHYRGRIPPFVKWLAVSFLGLMTWGNVWMTAQQLDHPHPTDNRPLTPAILQLPLSSLDPIVIREARIQEFQSVIWRGRVTPAFEMYTPRSEADIEQLQQWGFTQVMLDRPHLHSAATRLGLHSVLGNWWHAGTSAEEMNQGFARARLVAPPMLRGFSVMDEPERNHPETPFDFYRDLYRQRIGQFREDFPHTRWEISHWGPVANLTPPQQSYYAILYQAADAIRIMPYPDLHEGPLDEVFYQMQRSRRIMQQVDRELPLIVILQTWIWPPKNQLPEIAELRVMAYQAILTGAETLSFFDFNREVWEQTPGFETKFAALMQELTEISRRYREHELTTAIDDRGVLTCELRGPQGDCVTIRVNTQRYPVGDLEPLAIDWQLGPAKFQDR